MTITEFLLARIAEDEDQASLVTLSEVDMSSGVPQWQYRSIRDRVLAECEAKRQQIAHLVDFMEGDYAPWNEDQLKMMASVYADHPDYDQEWALVTRRAE